MKSLFRTLLDLLDRLRERFGLKRFYLLLVPLAAYSLVIIILGFLWSWTPNQFNVKQLTESSATERNEVVVVGSYTTTTLIELTESLLSKQGGYLSNDRFLRAFSWITYLIGSLVYLFRFAT